MKDTTTTYGVISPALAIDSMRKNGYLTTDNAIAEIIDNSIEANASKVEVLLFEHEVQARINTVQRINRIGVLDNGHGMDMTILRRSLMFGGGNRMERAGMGRFGFGLPNSSISQARRVEVWSWQRGPDNSMWTYLDVDEVRAGDYKDVPEPIHRPLPEDVQRLVGEFGLTGTYVQWDELDPDITWKRGKTVIKHTEFLVGRIYRYFLTRTKRRVQIRMLVIDDDGTIEASRTMVPNDPLYLMTGTSSPWSDQPMFQEYGRPQEFTFVDKEGRERLVTVTISYAKPACRRAQAGVVAGNLAHGKHALSNQGVSIVRAGRELQLEDCINVDRYRDRWWGVEISFSPHLDELFGVSNNKQSASNLVSALKAFDADPSLSVDQLLDQGDLYHQEDRVELYRMAQWTVEQVRNVMKLIKKQNEGEGDGRKRHEEPSDEDRASDAVRRRAKSHPTEDEEAEKSNPTSLEDQYETVKDSLIRKGYGPKEAENIISVALDRDRRVLFVESRPGEDGDYVFSIESVPGARVEVVFNVNHPAHGQIFESLSADTQGLSEQELVQRLETASSALKLMFAAWTRMELEAREGPERQSISRIRRDWGRMAADFLDPSYSATY